jgi:hypothetical protein
MTVGTGQARTFCNDEISYGRSSGPDTSVQVSSLIAGHGIELFRLPRKRDWKAFVVCGFTEGKGSRKHFGALLLGVYRNGKLRYLGHSGTGFSERD